jgi:prepilin-type N-terminal cleavage/methylation domain-containing protein
MTNSKAQSVNVKPGFTLIEFLTVAAIIGLLLSIVAYSITQALRQARDTKRKSDLTAISLGFQARFQDKTCDSLMYPGQLIGAVGNWQTVARLNTLTGVSFCDTFSNYLSSVPTDPKDNANHPYQFNLSTKEDNLSATAKHYRLTAKLERSSQTSTEFGRMLQTWQETFGGKNPPPPDYNYIIGN